MKTALCVLLVAALALCGCTTSTKPVTPPAPAIAPQLQVLQAANVAAAGGNLSAHVLVTLCVPPAGQAAAMDLVTCNKVSTALKAIKTFVDTVTIEANKVQSAVTAGTPAAYPWSVARINIAAAAIKITTMAAVSDPILQADINALTDQVAKILGVQ
jgi:hypothetical protein